MTIDSISTPRLTVCDTSGRGFGRMCVCRIVAICLMVPALYVMSSQRFGNLLTAICVAVSFALVMTLPMFFGRIGTAIGGVICIGGATTIIMAYVREPSAYYLTVVGFQFAALAALIVVSNVMKKNRAMVADLSQLALLDGLTHLYNHRTFELRLTEEYARSDRKGTGLSLLFIDLDDFKRVNDTKGHKHGDTVLQEVGQGLRELSRKDDIPCRIGGDEFAVILPNTETPGALELVDRIQRWARSSPLLGAAEGGGPGLSIGISSTTDGGTSAEELRVRADRALYEAKRAKRI